MTSPPENILSARDYGRVAYQPPVDPQESSLKGLLSYAGHPMPTDSQMDWLRPAASMAGGKDDVRIYYQGRLELLRRRCVSIVGSREVSEEGRKRAARLAREMAEAGIVVVSGLAKGVDTAALRSASDAGGDIAAVIGTPLSQAYPKENAALQETIWRRHLLLTPFARGERVFRSNFPKRNRVMASITLATVIVEASDTSGTLHQAAECQRLGRWLFIMKSVAENPALKWPASFLNQPRAAVLEHTDDLLKAISHG